MPPDITCDNIFLFDNKIREKFGNVDLICGVDEVGRGCISGPIVAAAVVFSKKVFIPYLKESKSISSHKREQFFNKILLVATDVSCSIVPTREINRIGIGEANLLAIKNAVEKLSVKPKVIVVDGYQNPYLNNIDVIQYNVIKGDKKSAVVAAASIVAKVIRDYILKIYHKIFPYYDFENNKGYPTKKHILSISQIGISELHRYYAYKFVNTRLKNG